MVAITPEGYRMMNSHDPFPHNRMAEPMNAGGNSLERRKDRAERIREMKEFLNGILDAATAISEETRNALYTHLTYKGTLLIKEVSRMSGNEEELTQAWKRPLSELTAELLQKESTKSV
jgi:hypothetical protein